MKPRLIAICGESGTGKNEVVKIFKKMGIPNLISYTTRPKREGEVDGVDYIFKDKCPEDKSNFLEYVEFNGYQYWTDGRDLKESVYTIILEENGVRHFRDKMFDKVRLYVIKVDRDIDKRIESGGNVRKDKKGCKKRCAY